MPNHTGYTKIDTAKKCFAENLTRANFQTDPEKYNLYNGLANLAAAIEELQRQMEDIQRRLP